MMQHEEIRDLLAAYALGAVLEDERRAIEAHLRDCESCTTELRGYESTTTALATAVDESPLPPGFKEGILTRAIGEPEAAPEPRPDRRRRWLPAFALGGAALLAALVAISATVLESRDDAARQRRVLSLLASSDGISLAGEGDVIGRVAGDEFALAGVEPAPEGKTYQLWLMRGDACPSADPAECELVSAGTFDTEDGVALLELDEDAGRWEDAAVTVEADDGADFPTTDPFVHSL